ncbi:uncharacterized, partial [Tachysurus ichikawai]
KALFSVCTMGCSASKALKVIKVAETIGELVETVESKESEDGDAKSNGGDNDDKAGNDES